MLEHFQSRAVYLKDLICLRQCGLKPSFLHKIFVGRIWPPLPEPRSPTRAGARLAQPLNDGRRLEDRTERTRRSTWLHRGSQFALNRCNQLIISEGLVSAASYLGQGRPLSRDNAGFDSCIAE